MGFHPELEIRRHDVPGVDNHVLALVIHVGANLPVDFFDLVCDFLVRNLLHKRPGCAADSIWNPVIPLHNAAERPNLHRLFQLEKSSFHLVIAGFYGGSLLEDVIQISDNEVLALTAIDPGRFRHRLAKSFPQSSRDFRCEIVLQGKGRQIPALFESSACISFESLDDLICPHAVLQRIA